MKVYVVFGVEYHACRELLGIYELKMFALTRQSEIKNLNLFDDVIIQEVELNTNLEYLI